MNNLRFKYLSKLHLTEYVLIYDEALIKYFSTTLSRSFVVPLKKVSICLFVYFCDRIVTLLTRVMLKKQHEM